MATYGLNGTGQIPFTGWTNVLGNVSTGGQPSAPASLVAWPSMASPRTMLPWLASSVKVVRQRRQGNMVCPYLSGVGSTATASYKRDPGPSG